MKKWYVQVPFTGYVYVVVSAENAEAAIEAAFGVVDLQDKNQWGEVEFHKHVTRGNLCSAVLNDATAQETQDDVEDTAVLE